MTKTNRDRSISNASRRTAVFFGRGRHAKNVARCVSGHHRTHLCRRLQLFQSGKIEQAAKVFQLLSMLDHYQARFFIGLGAARQELGEYLQAIDAYSYAALVDVNDPRPPFHSAECHLKLEQLTEAESGFYSAKEMSAGKSQYADLHERAGIMLESGEK